MFSPVLEDTIMLALSLKKELSLRKRMYTGLEDLLITYNTQKTSVCGYL